jgi:putative alpha-1,2-mannosidase
MSAPLFRGGDDEREILDALEINGLVGVHGGRLEVREKLSRVQALITELELEGYSAHSTINHPDTELGYGYDTDRFSPEEARRLVTAAYDKQHA